jgi:hypothetical protein
LIAILRELDAQPQATAMLAALEILYSWTLIFPQIFTSDHSFGQLDSHSNRLGGAIAANSGASP